MPNLKKPKKDLKSWITPKFIIVYIIAVLVLVFSVVTFFSLRNLPEQIGEYNKSISELSGHISQFNENFNQRTKELSSAELLIDNTNHFLSSVYFGTADTDEKELARDFTAFSIVYKDKYYVITAGHCVEIDGEKYKNFQFKANDKDYFIPLKLIDYENNYRDNIDYAIFYDPKFVTTGLSPAAPEDDQAPQYVLGNIKKNLNLVKRYGDAEEGESGSPILNTNCHVVGIMIKKGEEFTPISVVLEAIDKIE